MRDPHTINQAEWGDAVIRAAMVTGRPFAVGGDQIDYSLQVDDLTLPEFWWLRRGGLYTFGGSLAASAGNNGAMEIRVTPGRSDAIGIIDHVMVGCSATSGFNLQVKAGVLGPWFSGSPADDRLSARPSMLEGSLVNTAVAFGFTTGAKTVFCPSGSTVFIPGPWVLSGHLSLLVAANTSNIITTFACQWRERVKLATEA